MSNNKFVLFFIISLLYSQGFDPETGDLIQKKFDPKTGDLIQKKFDPKTGKLIK